MTICFRSVIFFIMCASLVEVKSWRNAYFIGYFNFCSKWSLFWKMLVSQWIYSVFLKRSIFCFVNINFWLQNCQFWAKKFQMLEKFRLFFLSIQHYYWKRLSFGKTCFFLEKCAFFEVLYTLTTRLILIKISFFLRIC